MRTTGVKVTFHPTVHSVVIDVRVTADAEYTDVTRMAHLGSYVLAGFWDTPGHLDVNRAEWIKRGTGYYGGTYHNRAISFLVNAGVAW